MNIGNTSQHSIGYIEQVHSQKSKEMEEKFSYIKNKILSTLIQHVPLVLARAVRQKRKTKGLQLRKEEVKVSLFIADMIPSIEDSIRTLVKPINTFSKDTRRSAQG